MLYKIYVSKFQRAKVLPGFNKMLAISVNNDLCRVIIQVQGLLARQPEMLCVMLYLSGFYRDYIEAWRNND